MAEKMCEACGECQVFRSDGFVSKFCVACGGYGKPCDRCDAPTSSDRLHVWQPPEAIAFACTKTEYHVCDACIVKLPSP